MSTHADVLGTTDEATAVASAREGDTAAFAALARRHGPALGDLARAAAYEGAAAGRLLAEAWAQVLQIDPPDGSDVGGATTLRARVARALAGTGGLAPAPDGADLRGAAVPQREFDATADERLHGHWVREPQLQPGLSSLQPAQATAIVRTALTLLPPMQWAVVSLRDVHGWTAEEVSYGLDVDIARQRRYLHLGRAAVRSALVRALGVSSSS